MDETKTQEHVSLTKNQKIIWTAVFFALVVSVILYLWFGRNKGYNLQQFPTQAQQMQELDAVAQEPHGPIPSPAAQQNYFNSMGGNAGKSQEMIIKK